MAKSLAARVSVPKTGDEVIAARKELQARRRYLIMRIAVLRAEIDDEAKKRDTHLAQLRSNQSLTEEAKSDVRYKYIYSSERYKEARLELQTIIANSKEISERLKAIA